MLVTTISTVLIYAGIYITLTSGFGTGYEPVIKYPAFIIVNVIICMLISIFDGLLLRRIIKTFKESFKFSLKINTFIYIPAIILVVIVYSPFNYFVGGYANDWCRDNLKVIGELLYKYSLEHDGKIPTAKDIDELKSKLAKYYDKKMNPWHNKDQDIEGLFSCPVEQRISGKKSVYKWNTAFNGKIVKDFNKDDKALIIVCLDKWHGDWLEQYRPSLKPEDLLYIKIKAEFKNDLNSIIKKAKESKEVDEKIELFEKARKMAETMSWSTNTPEEECTVELIYLYAKKFHNLKAADMLRKLKLKEGEFCIIKPFDFGLDGKEEAILIKSGRNFGVTYTNIGLKVNEFMPGRHMEKELGIIETGKNKLLLIETVGWGENKYDATLLGMETGEIKVLFSSERTDLEDKGIKYLQLGDKKEIILKKAKYTWNGSTFVKN